MIVLGGGFTPWRPQPDGDGRPWQGVISGKQVFKNTVAFDLLAQRDGVIFCDDSQGCDKPSIC